MADFFRSCTETVADIGDNSTILIGGFGEAGTPTELIHALINQGASNLTVVSNNAGNGELGLARLLKAGQVKKIICSYPRSSHSHVFTELYKAGKVELEVVPQGTLAERIRAGGAGIGGFYTPTGVDTILEHSREVREINGKRHVLEYPITADYALIKAEAGDKWGNLTYNMAARNFGPVMCTAAKTTIVQVRAYQDSTPLNPEHVVSPGIFVQRITEVPSPLTESKYLDDIKSAQKIIEELQL